MIPDIHVSSIGILYPTLLKSLFNSSRLAEHSSGFVTTRILIIILTYLYPYKNKYEYSFQAIRAGFKNWHQWELIAKSEINHFKDAGSTINCGAEFVTTQLARPLTTTVYMNVIVVRSRKA